MDNATPAAPPDREEVPIAIQRFKCNKASGYDDLDELMNSLKQEEMSWLDACTTFSATYGHWKACQVIGVLVYSGISLIMIAYRILSSIPCERLKAFVNKLIGSYQCGFRPGKSTMDQIFALRQILEKTQKKQIETHHLIVYFKFAFDTPHNNHLYATMSEFGIIRLCEMTLKWLMCRKGKSEPFDANRGFRQGDSLSCDSFNILMERIIYAAGLRHSGKFFL